MTPARTIELRVLDPSPELFVRNLIYLEAAAVDGGEIVATACKRIARSDLAVLAPNRLKVAQHELCAHVAALAGWEQSS